MTPMITMRRLLLAVLCACALPLGSAQAAATTENVATAIVEQDGASVFDFAWQTARQTGGAVDHHNLAEAAARCDTCDATAIAFQIVVVSRPTGPIVPVNEAVALNQQCTNCTVVAEARQFVRVFDRRVRFTGPGRAELRDIRGDLQALEGRDDLDVAQLHQAIEDQEARVDEVLDTEIVLQSDADKRAKTLRKRLLQAADVG